MRTNPRHFRVFLASPGDVTDERAVALKVLSDLPYDPLLRGQLTLDAVAWDNIGGPPMEANLTPQEAIRKGFPLPSQCDIFVAVFWSRMGTPVEIDGLEYLSGTHYEYAEALSGNRDTGTPRILLYRCTRKVSLDPDSQSFSEDLKQYQSLKGFFDSFRDPLKGTAVGGYNQYEDLDQYRKLLENHLRFILGEYIKNPPETQDANREKVKSVAVGFREHFDAEWCGSPFPGLRSFSPVDEPIFFGRGEETNALVEKVRKQFFTAVVGASGSGKSSVVGAGLIPRLMKTSRPTSWLIVNVTPDYLGTGDPFASLAAALLGQLPDFKEKRLALSLCKNPAQLSKKLEPYLSTRRGKAKFILVIDQFEELFTTVDPVFKKAFAEMIKALADARDHRVVLTIRGDFYGKCLEMPSIADLLQHGTFPLPSPSLSALHEMITRPAYRAGLIFEEGLPGRILDDTGDEPGSLALMAYTLDELYHACEREGVLSISAYENLDGVQGAIGKRAEAVFLALDTRAKSSLPQVFRELVEVDERGTATRRRERFLKVAPNSSSKQLVEELTNARLLVQSRDEANEPFVEVAHEALLRSWTRVALWIEETQEDLRLLRQVRNAAGEWNKNNRSDVFLWPHERLEPVYQMQKKLGVNFDPIVKAFVRPELDRLIEEWNNHSSRGHRRFAIIDRLAEIGDSAIPALMKTLDPINTEAVRVRAARVLGSLGAASAIPVLIDLASDGRNIRLQTAAVIALGKLKARQAVPVLVELLSKVRRWGREITCQRASATALGRIGDKRAIPMLKKVSSHKDRELRRAANAAIRKIDPSNLKKD